VLCSETHIAEDWYLFVSNLELDFGT